MIKNIKSARVMPTLLVVLLFLAFCAVTVSGAAGASDMSEDAGIISFGEAAALTDQTVSVALNILDNPGLVKASITLDYDKTAITLISVENGEIFTELDADTDTALLWSEEGGTFKNGLLATLTFEINKDAELKDYIINATVNEAHNESLGNVSLAVSCGKIAVFGHFGDTNGDGGINALDVLMLIKYMANYDYSTGTSSVALQNGADVNGDRNIGALDVLMLRRYMANYNYNTQSSSVLLGPQKTAFVVRFADSVMFGGETLSELTVPASQSARPPRSPYHDGYVFLGWDIDDLSSVTSDVTVTALYRPLDTYTLEFYNGNELLYSLKVKEGDAVVFSEPLKKEGFIFTGWDKPIDCVDRSWEDFEAYKHLTDNELSNTDIVFKTSATFEAVDGNIPYVESIVFELKEEKNGTETVYAPADADKFSEAFVYTELNSNSNYAGAAVDANDKYNKVKAKTSYAWDGEFIYGYVVIEDETLLSMGEDYCKNTKDPWQNDVLEYWYSLKTPISKENQRFTIDFYGHSLGAYDGSEGGYNSMSKFFDQMAYEVRVVEETKTSYMLFKLPAKTEAGEALTGGDIIYSAIQLDDIRDLQIVNDSIANMYCSTSNHVDYENGYERYTLGMRSDSEVLLPPVIQTPTVTEPPSDGKYETACMLNEETFTSLNLSLPTDWELYENADLSYSVYRENTEIGQIFKGEYSYKGGTVISLKTVEAVYEDFALVCDLNKNVLTEEFFYSFVFSYENKLGNTDKLTLFLKYSEASEETLEALKGSSCIGFYEKYNYTGDLLPDSGTYADSVLICGNSFVGSSRISAILKAMCEEGNIACEVTAISRGYARVSTYTSDTNIMSDIRNGKYGIVFMCGLYSESELDEIQKLKNACDVSNTRLVIFPAHNEYRVAIEKAKTRFPDIYILDWKAEIDEIIEGGVDFWLMCINDSHKHSTPLAGFVGAHMIYRATFGQEPPVPENSDAITKKQITDNLSDYLRGFPVLSDRFSYYKLK